MIAREDAKVPGFFSRPGGISGHLPFLPTFSLGELLSPPLPSMGQFNRDESQGQPESASLRWPSLSQPHHGGELG